MGRRRLQAILAATVLATGLSALPASAGPLGELTDTVTDTVDTAADAVTDTVNDATQDGPITSDIEVEVAPSDADGSPQLEVDGGITIADETIEVGEVTEPVEDAIDPDPAPTPAPTGEEPTSRESGDPAPTEEEGPSSLEGPASVVGDDEVVPAGEEAELVEAPAEGSSAGIPAGIAGTFVSDSRYAPPRGYSDAPTGFNQVPDPRVAPPVDDTSPAEGPQSYYPLTATPTGEAPRAIAAGPAEESSSAGDLALRIMAALMVLGTAIVFRRATADL